MDREWTFSDEKNVENEEMHEVSMKRKARI